MPTRFQVTMYCIHCPGKYQVRARCSKSKSRVGTITLKDETQVKTPVFMPVGTNGIIKGFTPEQIEATSCRLILMKFRSQYVALTGMIACLGISE